MTVSKIRENIAEILGVGFLSTALGVMIAGNPTLGDWNKITDTSGAVEKANQRIKEENKNGKKTANYTSYVF